ncbi:MAG: hypothetical protein JNM93_08600 [Bacteriovoracaceae bacterium]|nr:hypothetical protein [Bacteriovoracaceae bacterium]
MFKNLVGIFWLVFTASAAAHPVIFNDGIVVSSSNMESYSDNQLLYTFTNKWSTGVNHWRFSQGKEITELGLVRLNHLLWRRNADDSQANIYLLSGIGMMDSENDAQGTSEAYMGGFEFDWETRTLFTALKHYYFSGPSLADFSMTQMRIGVSPFEAGFEELQSWLMLQVMYMPEVDSTIVVTPMLRFFYKNVLWEFGSSTRGEWMLNLMVHY